MERRGPVWPKSELCALREVSRDLKVIQSEGGELDEKDDYRGHGKEGGGSNESVQIKKDEEAIESDEVEEECCNGDAEEKYGERMSENLLKCKEREGSKNELKCVVEKQHVETKDEVKLEAVQNDSEEESAEIDKEKEGSKRHKTLERSPLSHRKLIQSKGGETEGDEDSLKWQTSLESEVEAFEVFETGFPLGRPANLDEKTTLTDVKMIGQKRKCPAGNMKNVTKKCPFNIEVGFSVVCSHTSSVVSKPIPDLADLCKQLKPHIRPLYTKPMVCSLASSKDL